MTTLYIPDPKFTRSGTRYNNMGSPINVTVTPALTPFSEANPRAWFLLAESRFTTSKITDDVEKTSRILEALSPAVFERIAPWLETKIADTLKYSELKDELLSFYTASDHTRAKQILDMTNNPSEKPSDRWRRMDALQHDAEGSKLDMVWQLWLISLPSRVRIQVQDMSMDKSKIIRKADSLLKQLEEDDSRPIMAAQKPSRQRPRQRDDDRDRITDGACWYHNRFGDRSKKCIEGCKKYSTFYASKNAPGDRQ